MRNFRDFYLVSLNKSCTNGGFELHLQDECSKGSFLRNIPINIDKHRVEPWRESCHAFLTTGPLWGESKINGGFPSHRASNVEFWWFICCWLERYWTNSRVAHELRHLNVHMSRNAIYLLDKVDAGLQIHTEVDELPVDALLFVFFLFQHEHVMVEELLQTLVGVVDTQLLECVVLKKGKVWWIPLTKASDTERWCFLWSTPEQTAEQTIETPVIWDAIALIMTSL